MTHGSPGSQCGGAPGGASLSTEVVCGLAGACTCAPAPTGSAMTAASTTSTDSSPRMAAESRRRRWGPSSGPRRSARDADDGAAGQAALQDRVERRFDLLEGDLAGDRVVELRRAQVVRQPAPDLRALLHRRLHGVDAEQRDA